MTGRISANESIPTLKSIGSILFDEAACVTWLYEQGILVAVDACAACGGAVRRHDKIFSCTQAFVGKHCLYFMARFLLGAVLSATTQCF